MKKVLRSLFMAVCAVALTTTVSAQLPDGSDAPDFTETDLNGNEVHLQSLLDQGYTVIIDVMATWCGPCWSYAETGALEDIWANHGPDGDNTMYVLMIEGDMETTIDDIYGTGSNTLGDWTEGVDYPIIDDGDESLVADYEIGYYPTIYRVCPDGIITEAGQASYEDHYFGAYIGCELATDANDAMLFQYTGDAASCGEANISVEMYNFGTENLTSATVDAVVSGNVEASTNWTGNLAPYESTIVEVGSIATSGETTVEVVISSADDNADNNSVMATIAEATEATTEIRVDILTDCWPEETTYEILNSAGNVVASGGPYTGMAQTQINEVHWVAVDDCYSFKIYDAYGDGLNGASWSSCGVDGNAICYSVNDDGSTFSTIYSYNGSYWFADEFAAANATTAVGIEENSVAASLNIFPNPVNEVATVNFSVVEASKVTLDVINMLGQQVITEDFGTVVAGEHVSQIDFSTLDAGIYMVNLTVNGNITTTKVNVTK